MLQLKFDKIGCVYANCVARQPPRLPMHATGQVVLAASLQPSPRIRLHTYLVPRYLGEESQQVYLLFDVD
jgi:hypothetical protein